MDRFREGTHMSISMIKEATGTALTAAMAGASKSLRKEKAPARPASRVPKKAASRKPPMIRKKEKAMDDQKSGRSARSQRRRRTETGDTNSISCPM